MASGQVVLARRLGALDYATSFSACTCVKVGEAARTPLDLKGSASVISAAATPRDCSPNRTEPSAEAVKAGLAGRVAVPPPAANSAETWTSVRQPPVPLLQPPSPPKPDNGFPPNTVCDMGIRA